MKKLLIGVAVILIILAALFVYAATNVGKLVAQYKPDIERAASQALGSTVTLGEIETSVFPDAKIHIGKLRLEGNSSSESFTLKNLLLHVKLLPLLTGSLDIEKLSIDKPVLTLIKTKDGIQIEGLPKPKTVAPATAPKPAAAPAPASQPAPLPAALKLNLDRFEILEAQVIFKDEEAKKEYQLSKINLASTVVFKDNIATIQDLLITASLLNKAPLKLHAAGSTFNLADGKFNLPKLEIDLLGNEITLKANFDTKNGSGEFGIDSTGIKLTSLDPLLDMAPQVRSFGLGGVVKPAIAGQVKPGAYKVSGSIGLTAVAAKAADLQVSDLSGLLNIDATTTAQGAKSSAVTLKLNGAPVKISFDAGLEGTQAKLNSLTLEAFSGSVAAKAEVALSGPQAFNSTITLRGIKIEQALTALKPPLAQMVSGTLSNIEANINGNLGPALMQSLKGDAKVLAENCLLNGVNIAADVLKVINEIPFLQGSRVPPAPADQQAVLASKNTAIQSLSGDFVIGGAALTTENLKMLSSIFSLDSDGRVGFDSSLNLNATISFSKAFSAGLASRTKEIKKVLDANGQLVVPLTLKGTPPKVLILPNVEKLLQGAGGKLVEEKAEKLLNDVLSGKRGGKKGGLFGF